MGLTLRYAAVANNTCDLAIERMSDGLFFDFNAGAFSSIPGNTHLSISQAGSFPGRYMAKVPHQQPMQFVAGETYVFWIFAFTGMTQPQRAVAWMAGVTIDKLPFHLNDWLVLTITEPDAAF